jgi:hypothetical protein
MNQCSIPGVGNFLEVASEILAFGLIEISSLDQLSLLLTEESDRTLTSKNDEEFIYKIPSWLLK